MIMSIKEPGPDLPGYLQSIQQYLCIIVLVLNELWAMYG